MREIKFRGKSTITGAWVYGDLLHRANGPEIYSPYSHSFTPVIARTVSQYTGLKDENGVENRVEIWEGDVVQGLFGNARVDWSVKLAAFVLNDNGQLYDQKLEVIGNIYENPELVK